jgi:hypothetical protein
LDARDDIFASETTIFGRIRLRHSAIGKYCDIQDADAGGDSTGTHALGHEVFANYHNASPRSQISVRESMVTHLQPIPFTWIYSKLGIRSTKTKTYWGCHKQTDGGICKNAVTGNMRGNTIEMYCVT